MTPAHSEKVYRVVRADGTPESTRVWTNRAHARLSLRHSWSGHHVQEGTVSWGPSTVAPSD